MCLTEDGKEEYLEAIRIKEEEEIAMGEGLFGLY